ncbi:MAG: tRNA (adenosine(37)-N6)-threonylcarbamoyltransferase complex transferase subunit TsaD [Proteobacteria bacterium]|nr:tRNA (adenosine(37)-N6)-threonylcarbamoyltransferase complex transferase subunit TsaD [Pseudomonadota bacterium]
MIILGIESSCDDTALAWLDNGQDVLGSCVTSQISSHSPYGGVVPELAARDHLSCLPALFSELMAQSQRHPNFCLSRWQGIAVTQGPGLLGSLLVGYEFAQGLALSSQLPLIGVDHVLAHFHGVFVDLAMEGKKPHFPALGYVVSGGHTHLFRLRSMVDIDLIAHTIDDACGECFDKVGGMLGLPYPGGPHIEKLATSGNPLAYPMPEVMAHKKSLQLSYSGLKTYVYNLVNKLKLDQPEGELPHQTVCDMAASFQREAFLQLTRKLEGALIQFPDTVAIYVCGGVACNQVLHQMVAELAIKHGLIWSMPQPSLCTDNAVMIASMGYHQLMSDVNGDLMAAHTSAPYTRLRLRVT